MKTDRLQEVDYYMENIRSNKDLRRFMRNINLYYENDDKKCQKYLGKICKIGEYL